MPLLSNGNNPRDLFSFAGSVGRFGDNIREDVIKAQALLANAGYYDLPDPGMPTGWPGGELNRALTRFQKDHGLEPDGTLLPLGPDGVAQNGVGETVQALQDELGDRLKGLVAPDVQEADDFYRLRPMLGGDGEPPTNVHLRSQNGTGGHIGLKPVASNAPSSTKPEAGQQLALMRDPRRDPTLQKNFLPDGPMIPGGGGGRGGGRVVPQEKAPTPVRPTTEKNPRSPAMPGQTAPSEAVPDFDTSRPPDPAQPEEDRQQQDFAKPQRGRIIIAEDGKELHVPPLGKWADELSPEDRQIAEALNESLAVEMDGLHTGGSRGNRQTQEGVNIAIQECLKELKAVLPEATITHEFGGNPNGKVGKEAKKEENLGEFDEHGNPVRKGSNRSDWSILVARNIAEMMRGNTYDSKGGKPADRESNAETRIKQKSPNEEFVMVEKQNSGRSEEEFRRDVRDVCRAAGERIRAKWDKEGEFKKPAPKVPAEYGGPENAQRARKARELRKKQ